MPFIWYVFLRLQFGDFHSKEDSDDTTQTSRHAEHHFKGEKRLNDTHESTRDAEARLDKKAKGSEAKLAYLGHSVIENRHGLIVKAKATQAQGCAERDTAKELLAQLPGAHRKTVGADKNYDTKGFVSACRTLKITPHVACNTKRRGGSAIDARTTRHEGYRISGKVRKRVEEPFGWAKTVGLLRQLKVRGLALVNEVVTLTFIGWNLTRMKNLTYQSV